MEQGEFSIELFFEELQAILAKEQKAGKKLRGLQVLINEHWLCAKACGLIDK